MTIRSLTARLERIEEASHRSLSDDEFLDLVLKDDAAVLYLADLIEKGLETGTDYSERAALVAEILRKAPLIRARWRRIGKEYDRRRGMATVSDSQVPCGANVKG